MGVAIMPIHRTDTNKMPAHLNIVFGDGDLLIAQTDQGNGLILYENPDNTRRPVGEVQPVPPYAGERITCITNQSTTLFFSSTRDIDLLIADLEKLKDNFTEGGGDGS
jgi:hypothetical protein